MGKVLAFHAKNAETDCVEEAYVGEVTHQIPDSDGGPAYTLHYFDMMVDADIDALGGELDAGGCYQKVADPEDSSLAWTQDVREGEILKVVVPWGHNKYCM